MNRTQFLIISVAIVATLGSCQSSDKATVALDQPQVQEISILKLDSLNGALVNPILLDVRSDYEWDQGHLQGASFISYDWDDRVNWLKNLPSTRPILVYCEAGGRSGVITEELRVIGHPYIIDLVGGMEQWNENQFPVSFEDPVPLPSE